MLKVTIEDCRYLARAKNGKCLSPNYKNAHTKYLWECENGHIWIAKYNTIQQGCWCLQCSGKQKHIIDTCRKLAAKRNGKCLSDKYINKNTKYLWQCERGHQWYAQYSNIRLGRWCPECATHNRKQTNLKKYGTKTPLKNKEIREKILKTNLLKYGAENPMQNKDIALKSAKSSNNSCVLFHWKTNEELVCQGSYEKKTVEWLNEGKVEYEWQPKVFEMPGGKTYRPDLYLTKEDKWAEIKGYFRKDAAMKWDWFQGMYPNSELWDKNKLQKIGII